MANENKMGYLPIKKLILQMSLPPMCSMFLQYSYNLVDSMFVANINENALAAVSLSFPITTLMISLSIWIGVGINVLIAGYLGEKEQDLADCATTLGLLVALIVGICINILALLIMKPYFSAFTNNPAIFDYAMQYMSVCAFMQVPNMVHIAIQKVFLDGGTIYGAVEGESVSGDLSIEKAAAGAELSTVSGKMTIGEAQGDISMESVSGEILVEKAEDPRFKFEAQWVSGGLETDFDGQLEWEKRSAQGIVTGGDGRESGEGLPRIQFTTTSGDMECYTGK